jgi:tetratricopeptide (TPR) repeat protein
MIRTPLVRTLTVTLLAALAACTTLQGPQRPAPRPSGTAAAPSSESPSTSAPGAANGAAGLPSAPAAPPSVAAPGRPPRETAGATQALLAQSRSARAAGNYPQANAAIERALRIAPDDASLWVELGEIELASGNQAQAATLARKALTLAANDSVTAADARKLLRAAGGR